MEGPAAPLALLEEDFDKFTAARCEVRKTIVQTTFCTWCLQLVEKMFKHHISPVNIILIYFVIVVGSFHDQRKYDQGKHDVMYHLFYSIGAYWCGVIMYHVLAASLLVHALI